MVVSGGRTFRISGLAFCSFTGAVRSVLCNRQVRSAFVCTPRSDHGTLRGAASALLAFRSRRGRFRRPAPERFAPTVTGRPAHRANSKMADEEGAGFAGRNAEERK